MVSKKIEQALAGSSVIRAMFTEGKEMAKKYGAENVYDFSLGNPATPAPEAVKESIKRLLDEKDPMFVHGYMDNSGYEQVREKIAQNLNERFDTHFHFHNIIMTVGAAGGLNIIFKAILDPADEVMVFAPYFGEYRSYASNFDAKIVEVNPDITTFEPNLTDFEAKITEKTKAVIINTPNNPTGVVYKDATLKAIATILKRKQEEYKTDIYLISDEPYRELIYDGIKENFLTKYYENTIVGYSFSKSLSLPGERIGYVLVPDEASDSERLISGINVANRTLGFVNAPSLMQLAVAECLNEKTDVAYYDINRTLLYEGLKELGFSCFKPEGAFYLWMKSPDEDENRFVEQAKKYHLILVPGSAFAWKGYVRIAYCVSKETIEHSLPAFKKLAEEYHLS